MNYIPEKIMEVENHLFCIRKEAMPSTSIIFPESVFSTTFSLYEPPQPRGKGLLCHFSFHFSCRLRFRSASGRSRRGALRARISSAQLFEVPHQGQLLSGGKHRPPSDVVSAEHLCGFYSSSFRDLVRRKTHVTAHIVFQVAF